jgi:hypothetical protein
VGEGWAVTATIVAEHTALGVGELPEPPPAVSFGPTWRINPDWTPGSTAYKYALPEATLGWQVQAWVEGIPGVAPANILSDDVDDEGNRLPFKLTDEQLRFILWMYAISPDPAQHGRFIFREIVLQRLKGWGKDPLAAVIAAVEFVGPCRFAGWAARDLPHLGLAEGDPVARPHPRAWVQIAATSKEQTKNTMMMFPGFFSKSCMDENAIDLGKQIIYAHHGRCRIEAVTSSPSTLEGARSTFVIKNETHHWKTTNDGHDMADVIERNITKSKDGASRSLSITNAYEPSEDSVAQLEREAWEDEVAAGWESTTMYDSLEAHPNALINLPAILVRDGGPGEREYRDPTKEEVEAYVSAVVLGVRGDAVWLDIPSIVDSIITNKRGPSRSRRFYYNQVVAAEDAWAHPMAVEAAVEQLAIDARRAGFDPLRDGWLVGPDEPIVMFFDGSKSRDATGLVGCRLSDGYVFTIGVWQQPKGKAGDNWLVPRDDVDLRVHEAHERFTVVAFFGDPSHSQDDADDTRYWDPFMDEWHRKYKDRYLVWAVKDGITGHSIMWDMTSPARHTQFVRAAERFIGELERKNDIEEFDPAFRIDGHPALVNHIKNAKRYPVPKVGISLFKGERSGTKKIDLAVCAVGARMLRRIVLNIEKEEEPERSGVVW